MYQSDDFTMLVLAVTERRRAAASAEVRVGEPGTDKLASSSGNSH